MNKEEMMVKLLEISMEVCEELIKENNDLKARVKELEDKVIPIRDE